MNSASVIQKQQFNVTFRPGTADENVLGESFERDLFFPGLPEYRLKAGDTILDIGAHIGCFTLLAASKVTEGRVFSFEPSAGTFEFLAQNVRSNNLTNVKIFRVVVSANNGTAALYHDMVTGKWGHTITKAISRESEKL